MAKYRARSCPHCRYFVAFSVSKPLPNTKEVGVTSFCLNCNYRLPIHTILHGIRRATSHFRRAPLKLANNLQPDRHGGLPGRETNPHDSQSGNRMFSPEDHSGHLRTIGQQLQQQRIDTFNLQCTADGYSIWSHDDNLARPSRSFFIFGGGPLEKWWGVKSRDGYAATTARPSRRLDYSLQELVHMESRARFNRGQMSGCADGHSLSQLLRTIGSLVYQRNHRLLGISWRDLSVCIVVETAQGKREIDVFRPDNLYDIWVRMYLRRDNRALSDVPH